MLCIVSATVYTPLPAASSSPQLQLQVQRPTPQLQPQPVASYRSTILPRASSIWCAGKPWQRSPGQSSTSHSRFAGHIGSSTRNKLFQLLLESLESNRYRRLFFVFLFRDLAKSRIRTFYYLPSFPCLWTEIFGEFGII